MKTLFSKGLTATLVTAALFSGQLRADEGCKNMKDGACCKADPHCKTSHDPCCNTPKEWNEANEHGASAYTATDIILVRPVGFAATLVGGALYLVSWPVTAVSGDEHKAYCTLVKQPASYVWHRGYEHMCDKGKCDGEHCGKNCEKPAKACHTPRHS